MEITSSFHYVQSELTSIYLFYIKVGYYLATGNIDIHLDQNTGPLA